MNKKWDPEKNYEIRVKATRASEPTTFYVGPWNKLAESKWAAAWAFYAARAIRRHVDDREIQAMFCGHPDLTAMEIHLDSYYVVPGDVSDPPNRLADPEIMSAVRRKAFPFDGRPEVFWPEGFDPDAIEGAA